MRLSRSALVAACVAGAAEACVSEHRRTFHPHKALSKRQDTPFPPELTADESVIVNSFDNRTIDEWFVQSNQSCTARSLNHSLGRTITLMVCI